MDCPALPNVSLCLSAIWCIWRINGHNSRLSGFPWDDFCSCTSMLITNLSIVFHWRFFFTFHWLALEYAFLTFILFNIWYIDERARVRRSDETRGSLDHSTTSKRLVPFLFIRSARILPSAITKACSTFLTAFLCVCVCGCVMHLFEHEGKKEDEAKGR